MVFIVDNKMKDGKFNLKVRLSKKQEHWDRHSSKAQCIVTKQKQDRIQAHNDEALQW